MGINLSSLFPEEIPEEETQRMVEEGVLLLEEIEKYHEESKEDIFRVIRKTIGRHVPIDIRVDKKLEIAFFDFLSDEFHFEKDFENMEKLDEILHYVTYYVPSIKEEYRVVATLHG